MTIAKVTYEDGSVMEFKADGIRCITLVPDCAETVTEPIVDCIPPQPIEEPFIEEIREEPVPEAVPQEPPVEEVIEQPPAVEEITIDTTSAPVESLAVPVPVEDKPTVLDNIVGMVVKEEPKEIPEIAEEIAEVPQTVEVATEVKEEPKETASIDFIGA